MPARRPAYENTRFNREGRIGPARSLRSVIGHERGAPGAHPPRGSASGERAWKVFIVHPHSCKPSAKYPSMGLGFNLSTISPKIRCAHQAAMAMNVRLLNPADTSAYRLLRLQALREWPPAFGTQAEDEENLPIEDFASRLEPTEQRRFLGAFADGVLVGSLRLSRYDGSNEAHKAYVVTPGLGLMPF